MDGNRLKLCQTSTPVAKTACLRSGDMTAIPNERQQTAQHLARSIGAMEGAWVTSPMPLDNGRRLRFQVLDGDRNRVLQQLRDWGWDPVFVSVLPRVTFVGMAAACLYEIELPRERQTIVDDRKIHGEIATPEKTSVELEGM